MTGIIRRLMGLAGRRKRNKYGAADGCSINNERCERRPALSEVEIERRECAQPPPPFEPNDESY